MLAGILAMSNDAVIVIGRDQTILMFNHGAEEIFGYPSAEVLGQQLGILLPEKYRAVHGQHVESFEKGAETSRRMMERGTILGRRKSGDEFAAEASITKTGEAAGLIATVVLRDITERRRVEALLKRSNAELEARVAERTAELQVELARRDQMQAALVKSQRLEAVGQLTGGVAHDFNNLLTVISGNLELLQARLAEPKSAEFVRRAMEASDMAARLTSRLLVFARQSRLDPVVLNLNGQVLNMTELLKRTLDEHIALVTRLAPDLWATRADPSEIENAVLNLAINARDAMPKGGRLVIQTENTTIDEATARMEAGQKAGEFVRLSVTDTGHGMPPEVLARAFEPFFTTKQGGRGTGLGLSTIYGFVQQSGGWAQIYSEVGEGTTVNIYLPRADGMDTLRSSNAEAGEVSYAENAQSILVVEDNEAVREVALQRLEGLGYVVQEAVNGAQAIAILEQDGGIDLVFSDVVMTAGLSGYDLAAWVARNRPHCKILLTSGFAAEALVAKPGNGPGLRVLRKPYNRADLSQAIRRVLND